VKFNKTGLFAIAPEALGAEDESDTIRRDNAQHSDLTIIPICGPLLHRAHPFFDSYEAILHRVVTACESGAKKIVLSIDSPGGVVSGLFDACSALKEIASSGVRIVAHVDGTCASAAYALASCASDIAVSSTAVVGSIGVLDARIDISKANDAQGVGISFVTSGKTKAFGHPDLALSDDEIQHRQQVVDDLAAVFFEHVQATRSLDARPLEAAVYVGKQAVAIGLADKVSTLNELLDQEESKDMTFDELMEALRLLAEGEGGDAVKAQEALDKLTAPEEEVVVEEEAPAAEVVEEEDKTALLSAQVQALAAQVAELTKPKLTQRAQAVTVAVPQGKPTKAPVATAFDARIDAAMGLTKTASNQVVNTDYAIVLGASAKKGN
jgi:ClpP class serine protease